MYQVLVVDDEPWVIRTLQSIVPWEQLGLILANTTTNSTEALCWMQENHPDIVITDVKMPTITGLDLMRFASEQKLTAEFIILSGYSDFEYAKQAIDYGVFSYLLKPIQKEEIVNALLLLTKNIASKEYSKQQQTESYLLHQLLFEEAYTKIEKEKLYTVVAAKVTFGDYILLTEHLEKNLLANARMGSNLYLYFLTGDSSAAYNTLLSFLQRNPQGEADFISFGISESLLGAQLGEDWAQLEQQVEHAILATQDYYFLQEHRVNSYRPLQVDVCNTLLNRVEGYLEQQDYESLSRYLLTEFVSDGKRLHCSAQDIGYLHNEILKLYESYLPLKPKQEALPFEELSIFYESFSEVAHFLERFLRSEVIQPESSSHLGFLEILDFLKTNFQENITLKELSDQFYINATYICDLFREELNTTFTQYVTQLRMEQAHQLICYTDKSLTEIVFEVGYRDYSYFIRQFKKYYAVSPGRLRKEVQASEKA